MYALGAVLGYFLTKKIAEIKNKKITSEEISDVIFWTMIGGVIGGRLFYVFVYNFSQYAENPWEIFAVWHGGMSIHGGFLGGALGLFLLSRKIKKSILFLADLFMPALALGLAFGRLGNFVNGELFGRPTALPWGMDFGDGVLRHPSQLYAIFKDLLLCGILLFFSLRRQLSSGKLSAIFFLLYGVFRFVVEFFREPDPQLGFLFFGLSMGQILSMGVFIFGIVVYFKRAEK